MSQTLADNRLPRHPLTYHTSYTTPTCYITYTSFMTRTDYISRAYCIACSLHTSRTSCIYSMIRTYYRPYTTCTISNLYTACMVRMASISIWFTPVTPVAYIA